MATKTFKEICVEYAHQLGKGLPLTPAEMCNAVIMYLNAQITEMQGITTALQTAVSEAESSAMEAINKADDVSETVNALPKVPTPTTSDNGKVIGVQSGAYALIEQSGGEVPDNMVTTDTSQTILANKGFKSNIYSNKFLYTGDYSDDVLEKLLRNESITGDDANYNEFSADGMTCGMYRYTNGGTKLESVGMSLYDPASFSPTDYGNANVTFYVSCLEVEKYTNAAKSKTAKYQLEYPNKDGVIALISDIPSADNFVTTNTSQTISGQKTFTDSVTINMGSYSCGLIINRTGSSYYSCYRDRLIGVLNSDGGAIMLKFEPVGSSIYNIDLPNNNGTVALTSDIPNLDNYTDTMHIVQGTAGSGIAVHDTANTSPYTKYGYGKIETYGNSNALKYTLNIPNKNGTIATLDDISSTPSSDKYFTRVIYHSIDEDTQYIIFSCITDTDLSTNTSYQNVLDLLNSLGANTHDTALPCSGKTVSGGILVGIYTDGGTIFVFDTDNSIEELNMPAEIKFISR